LLSDYETPRETFVRFKGMIQDMLNPEYFTKTYTVINSVTNETKICQGKYHTASIINVNIFIFKELYIFNFYLHLIYFYAG